MRVEKAEGNYQKGLKKYTFPGTTGNKALLLPAVPSSSPFFIPLLHFYPQESAIIVKAPPAMAPFEILKCQA